MQTDSINFDYCVDSINNVEGLYKTGYITNIEEIIFYQSDKNKITYSDDYENPRYFNINIEESNVGEIPSSNGFMRTTDSSVYVSDFLLYDKKKLSPPTDDESLSSVIKLNIEQTAPSSCIQLVNDEWVVNTIQYRNTINTPNIFDYKLKLITKLNGSNDQVQTFTHGSESSYNNMVFRGSNKMATENFTILELWYATQLDIMNASTDLDLLSQAYTKIDNNNIYFELKKQNCSASRMVIQDIKLSSIEPNDSGYGSTNSVRLDIIENNQYRINNKVSITYKCWLLYSNIDINSICCNVWMLFEIQDTIDRNNCDLRVEFSDDYILSTIGENTNRSTLYATFDFLVSDQYDGVNDYLIGDDYNVDNLNMTTSQFFLKYYVQGENPDFSKYINNSNVNIINIFNTLVINSNSSVNINASNQIFGDIRYDYSGGNLVKNNTDSNPTIDFRIVGSNDYSDCLYLDSTYNYKMRITNISYNKIDLYLESLYFYGNYTNMGNNLSIESFGNDLRIMITRDIVGGNKDSEDNKDNKDNKDIIILKPNKKTVNIKGGSSYDVSESVMSFTQKSDYLNNYRDSYLNEFTMNKSIADNNSYLCVGTNNNLVVAEWLDVDENISKCREVVKLFSLLGDSISMKSSDLKKIMNWSAKNINQSSVADVGNRLTDFCKLKNINIDGFDITTPISYNQDTRTGLSTPGAVKLYRTLVGLNYNDNNVDNSINTVKLNDIEGNCRISLSTDINTGDDSDQSTWLNPMIYNTDDDNISLDKLQHYYLRTALSNLYLRFDIDDDSDIVLSLIENVDESFVQNGGYLVKYSISGVRTDYSNKIVYDDHVYETDADDYLPQNIANYKLTGDNEIDDSTLVWSVNPVNYNMSVNNDNKSPSHWLYILDSNLVSDIIQPIDDWVVNKTYYLCYNNANNSINNDIDIYLRKSFVSGTSERIVLPYTTSTKVKDFVYGMYNDNRVTDYLHFDIYTKLNTQNNSITQNFYLQNTEDDTDIHYLTTPTKLHISSVGYEDENIHLSSYIPHQVDNINNINTDNTDYNYNVIKNTHFPFVTVDKDTGIRTIFNFNTNDYIGQFFNSLSDNQIMLSKKTINWRTIEEPGVYYYKNTFDNIDNSTTERTGMVFNNASIDSVFYPIVPNDDQMFYINDDIFISNVGNSNFINGMVDKVSVSFINAKNKPITNIHPGIWYNESLLNKDFSNVNNKRTAGFLVENIENVGYAQDE